MLTEYAFLMFVLDLLDELRSGDGCIFRSTPLAAILKFHQLLYDLSHSNSLASTDVTSLTGSLRQADVVWETFLGGIALWITTSIILSRDLNELRDIS